MLLNPYFVALGIVAPFAGAWIEIRTFWTVNFKEDVAPFAGAWIEIVIKVSSRLTSFVAPFAGAWIEMTPTIKGHSAIESLPSRERGLKLYRRKSYLCSTGRSLRGSVD